MTTHSQYQHYCVMLNNLGVHYINCGDYDLAVSTLRECMSTVRAALPRQQEQVQQQQHQLIQLKHERNIYKWFIHCSRTASHDKSPVDESDYFIYKNPISIPTNNETPTTAMSSSETHHEQQVPVQQAEDAISPIHAIVTLFNLSLCYHLKGLNTITTTGTADDEEMGDGDDDKETRNAIGHHYLKTSVALYKYCDDMIRSEHISVGPFFYMTIANNIGSIYSVWGDQDQAKVWFQHLLSTQLLIVDHKHLYHHNHHHGMEEEDDYSNINSDRNDDDCHQIVHSPFDGFWYNTSRLVLSNCSSPAA